MDFLSSCEFGCQVKDYLYKYLNIYIFTPPPHTHTQKHTDLFWLFIFRNEFTSALLNQPDSRKLIIDISLKETILIPTLDFI